MTFLPVLQIEEQFQISRRCFQAGVYVTRLFLFRLVRDRFVQLVVKSVLLTQLKLWRLSRALFQRCRQKRQWQSYEVSQKP